MSDAAEAGVAPAPVDAGSAAPAVESSSPMGGEASSEASAPASPAEISLSAESAESTPAFPSADDFGWDSWDGQGEALPESIRPWGDKFNSYYTTRSDQRVESELNAANRTKDLYDALLGGSEDPRVKEYGEKIGEWETKYSTLDDEMTGLRTEYDGYKKAIDEAVEEEAKQYASAFKDKNPDLFKNKDLANRFADLLEEGWDLESGAVASRLPAEALQVARQAKADGVPDAYALRLAQSTKSARAPVPRPGAKITSGATTPARSPEQESLDQRSAMSFQDLRNHVARRALKTNRR
jgi:hypothetical protein